MSRELTLLSIAFAGLAGSLAWMVILITRACAEALAERLELR